MNHLSDRLQSLLVQSPELANYLQHTVLDGIWYWQISTPNNKWISPRFWDILGYSTTDDDRELSEIIHPKDKELWSNFLLNGVSKKEISKEFTIRFLRQDGRTIWMNCKGIVLNEKKDPYVFLTFLEITKFKEKEKLWLDTNRNAKIGAWELLLETNELYWSDSTRSIHEVPIDFQPKLEDGINFYKEGYSRETIKRCVKEGLEEGKPWNVELQIITYAGKEIWVRSIGNVDFKKDKALRIYGSFQDIEEEKRMIEKLRQLSVIEAKNKEIEQFAYIVSHDLREPLTSMKGYLQLLIEDFSNNLSLDAKDLLGAVIQTANRMDVLMHDLLGYSIEGREEEKQIVVVEEIVNQVLADLSIPIQETQAILKVGILPTLNAYPAELKSVFTILISNALKFRNLNTIPVIEIKADQLKNKCRFLVADNGIGIPKGETKRIFNVFQRLYREEYIGTGIGLAICKKIVEHHNGQIWVESKLGEGSDFYFTVLLT